MKLTTNNRLSIAVGSQVSLSRGSQTPAIPCELVKQDAEIESLFRNLIRLRDGGRLDDSQQQTDRTWEPKLAGSILIIAFVLISIIEFYLLCRA
jgi:hypothetical protein